MVLVIAWVSLCATLGYLHCSDLDSNSWLQMNYPRLKSEENVIKYYILSHMSPGWLGPVLKQDVVNARKNLHDITAVLTAMQGIHH